MLYVFCSCGRLKQSAKEKLLVLSFTGNNENSVFFNFSLFIVSVGLYAEDHFFSLTWNGFCSLKLISKNGFFMLLICIEQ